MSVEMKKSAVETVLPVAVTIDGVSKRFAGRPAGQELLALDNVSLEVRKGEFVCLLGPSGCGKSTLLNIVGGLAEPSTGTVRLGNAEVRGPQPQEIAFVFQESTLLPWYTILENFRIAFKLRGLGGNEWQDHARGALRAVGMEQFGNHYPNQLSVGMRQRINVARSIFLETGILLMDEPFAALDEQTRMVMGEDLSVLLSRTGKTIIFVTHSLAEAVFLADRIVVMTARPGRVKEIIAVAEPHPRSPDFMLTPQFGDIRNRLYALLRDEIRQTVAAMRQARDGLQP